MESSDDTKPNFLKHVFKFDDDGKAELLNIIQYALLAIIPIVVLNKSMQKFVPEADEQKGNIEILAEILIQVIFMFVGLLIAHRIITFFPTYSGVKYPEFSVIFIILAVLMITMSLQTKLGDKVSILVERINDLWNGSSKESNSKKGKNGKNGNVKVSQPISGNTQILPQTNQSQYNDGTSINSLPTNTNDYYQQQQSPNFNNMYVKDTTPLVGAATPGQQAYPGQQSAYPESGEVVPASEFGGFGGFSAW
jgi:hypothetical protein